jgi:indolepyruvate ferredoxin oxidoreductase alpha subunit
MTGGQFSPAKEQQLEKICLGLGVHPDHVRTIKPLPKSHQDFVQMLQEEVDYDGISVIVARRECVRMLDRRMSEKAAAKKKSE